MALTEDYQVKLKDVFDVCDTDKVGLITIDHFRELAKEHLTGSEWQESISRIVKVLDPNNEGSINFTQFCDGIKHLLQLQNNSETILGSNHIDHCSDQSRYLGDHDESLLSANIDTDDDMNSISESGYGDFSNDLAETLRPIDSHSSFADQIRQTSLFPHPRHPSEDDVDSGFHGKQGDQSEHSFSVWSEHTQDEETYECLKEEKDSSYTEDGSPRFHRRIAGVQSYTPEGRRAGAAVARAASARLTPSAIANHLYRGASSSLDTSRRSSISDGIYEDIDGNFADLNNKVKFLEDKIQALSDSQRQSDEKNSRLKEENSTLIERVHLLEEQLRDLDSVSQELLAEERKKHRDILLRTEKDKSRDIDILTLRLQNIEKEYILLRDESPLLKSENDKLKKENAMLERELSQLRIEMDDLQDEKSLLQQHCQQEQQKSTQEKRLHTELIDELSKELEELRQYRAQSLNRSPNFAGQNGVNSDVPRSLRKEYESRISFLKQENAKLREEGEELHAQLLNKHVNEGWSLLQNSKQLSVAAELDSLPRDELLTTLQKEREANHMLREYMEQITLKILERNPSLLEVKSKWSSF